MACFVPLDCPTPLPILPGLDQKDKRGAHRGRKCFERTHSRLEQSLRECSPFGPAESNEEKKDSEAGDIEAGDIEEEDIKEGDETF